MPVPVPTDRRFRRVHVSPGRRRRGRRALWAQVVRIAMVALVLGFGLYHLVATAVSSEALTVSDIVVDGTEQLAGGEVLSLLSGMCGTNLITVNLQVWRERVLALPWVEDAALRRVFPGTVAVHVIERKPMAIGRVDGSLYLVDWNGGVIDTFGSHYADLDLPIVDGLGASGAERLAVDPDRAVLVARLLDAVRVRQALAGRVSQVDVTDLWNVVVILKGDTALVQLGQDRFVERLESYLDLAPALRERMPEIDYVDLRFDERVYVRPLDGDDGNSGRGPSGS